MTPFVAVAAALVIAAAAAAQEVASAPGAVLRALDKVSGEIEDIELSLGESRVFGRLAVTLGDCRYPLDDPASNAFAHLTIIDTTHQKTEFDGWMVAASPALSALDDPRYDLWLLRCSSS
jgi:hypothetical protein